MIKDALLNAERRWKCASDSTITAAIGASCPDHSLQHPLGSPFALTTAHPVTVVLQNPDAMQLDFSRSRPPAGQPPARRHRRRKDLDVARQRHREVCLGQASRASEYLQAVHLAQIHLLAPSPGSLSSPPPAAAAREGSGKLRCHPRLRDPLPEASPNRRALRAVTRVAPTRARADRYRRSAIPAPRPNPHRAPSAGPGEARAQRSTNEQLNTKPMARPHGSSVNAGPPLQY